ncbi:unnamed protein product, partial [Mesorhabditis belari]|uniref:Uncharacterized protein n=1 Tax=Mesorhabditis belari TaxID=2138241 RepID=A0AAF3F6R7_9BILA
MVISTGIVATLWFPVNPVSFSISALCIYSLFAGCLFVVYWRLWVYNHDVLHVLSKMHFGEGQYSLGVRFQVEENIRAINLLRCFIIFNMVFIGFNCFFTIVALEILDPEQPIAQLALALLDLVIAVPPFALLFISLHQINDWGKHFLDDFFKIFGRTPQQSSKNSITPINPLQETEIYFTYYKENW